MKPFNLQEALAGKRVVTRDGREVTGLKYYKEADTYYNAQSIVGLIGTQLWQWCNIWPGVFYKPSKLDLFMASEKKSGWINIYNLVTNPGFQYARGWNVFPTEAQAKESSGGVHGYKLVATIFVEWEE